MFFDTLRISEKQMDKKDQHSLRKYLHMLNYHKMTWEEKYNQILSIFFTNKREMRFCM